MSPPPELPKKKVAAPPPTEVEGIDLDDFDDPDEMAGFKVEPPAPPRLETPVPKATPAPPALVAPPSVAAPRSAPVRPPAVTPVAPPPRPTPPVVAPAPPVAPAKFPPPGAPAVPAPAPPPGGEQPWPSPAPAAPAAAAPPAFPQPPYQAQLPGAPPIYMAPPYGYAAPPVYYPQPGYYPGPYGYPPPVYYPQPVVYSIAPPPPARVWNTREALARINGAAAVGLCAFLLLTLQRAFEAATGVTDAPGSRAAGGLGLQALSVLLVIAIGLSLSLALLMGGSGMYRLHKGRAEFGEPDSQTYRRALQRLAIAAALPAAATALGWLYLDNFQHTLPGSGTISDAGLARLWDQYRAVVLVNALAGLAGAFCLAKGLEAPASGLTLAVPRRAYRLFALEFVAAAAVNVAMVLVAFFAVMVPPQVGVQASPPFAILLLLPGPVIAAHALFQLRIHLSGSLREVERLARERPQAAPPFA